MSVIVRWFERFADRLEKCKLHELCLILLL